MEKTRVYLRKTGLVADSNRKSKKTGGEGGIHTNSATEKCKKCVALWDRGPNEKTFCERWIGTHTRPLVISDGWPA